MELLISNYIFFVFLICLAIQFIYISFIHGRFAVYKKKNVLSPSEFNPPVSIIIAARNESDNLFKNLPLILEQDYPEFEVIVVNNQSVDDSNWLLMAFCRQYKNLRVVEIRKNKHLRPSKKFPLTMGIKGSKYEHLLLTDADCAPISKNWVRQMMTSFNDKNQVVLGYGPHRRSKSIFSSFFRFDTVWIAINYFSFCLKGIPYMGVGRNLAYTKSTFNSVQGFKSHYSIISGDDDLFIQEISKNARFNIQTSPDSYCFSPSVNSLKEWIRQKKRHHSTSKKYTLIKKGLLGIYPISMFLLLISFVYLLTQEVNCLLTSLLFSGLMLVKWIIHGKCLLKLGEKSFIPYMPIWDILYSIIMPIIFLFTTRKETQKW